MSGNSRRTRWNLGLALLILASSGSAAEAGSLDPSGPPAPTSTAVDETDPRKPIRAGDLPLTIGSPGSYYLAEEVSSANGGITIEASNVTIDLMGFSLSGGSGTGIAGEAEAENVTVRNGTVSGWSGDGIHIEGNGSLVAEVHASDNGAKGINLTSGLVRHSVARGNGDHGIHVPSGNVVDSLARGNGTGIRGALVTGSESLWNAGTGIVGLTVIESTSTSNSGDGFAATVVLNCVAFGNDMVGFRIGFSGEIRDSAAVSNGGDGIVVGDGALVVGNKVSYGTGSVVDGAGIRATGTRNIIDGNTIIQNDIGIRVPELGNFIVRNRASTNGINYSIAGGNDVGWYVQNPRDAGAWDNFEY